MPRYPVLLDSAEIRALIEYHASRISGANGMCDGVMYETADRIMVLAELLTGRRVIEAGPDLASDTD